ncbi:MAG: hypothetical protein WAT78_14040 [Rhizobiaceae bacterium]
MTLLRKAARSALILSILATGFASAGYAAGPKAGAIKSNVTMKPGWYCLIWERMSDGSWVCRLQEKRA